jgi:hypothetical protein
MAHQLDDVGWVNLIEPSQLQVHISPASWIWLSHGATIFTAASRRSNPIYPQDSDGLGDARPASAKVMKK